MTTETSINPHKIDFAKIPLSNEQRIVAALESIEKMMREYIAAASKPQVVMVPKSNFEPVDPKDPNIGKPGGIVPVKKRR